VVASFGCLHLSAAEVDISQLPPPVTTPVDFARDIQPILEANCLRCHGPEKPKNGFRLDNRKSALKGGENGVDIIPGDSAKSPLIHYVSYLVEDNEMPPIGKGERLSAEQVSLLRAWIDQGVAWNGNLLTNILDFSFSPVFGGTTMSGDSHKFSEHYWQKDGLNGGVEDFELFEQKGADTRLLLTGHALLNDYKITYEADQNNLGFLHAGWEQYRKYFDDTGGYYPALVTPAPTLGRDLYLDIGKAWVDLGITLPDWPRMVVGYEYDYRHGDEATLEWNSVGNSPANARNIGPASQNIDEGVHIIKFDLDAEIKGVTVEDRFRGEFYQIGTGSTNFSITGGPINVNQGTTYFQGANTFRLEKKFNDWFFGSAGYLYSKLDGNSTFNLDTPAVFQLATLSDITLERDSNVGNVNGLFGPFNGLVISTGAQAEFTHQNSFGPGTYEQNIPPPPFTTVPFNVSSDYDLSSVKENIAAHYTKIPFTALFAEARLEQQSIGQNDQFAASQDILNKAVFLQHTDFSSQSEDLRAGFETSPWRSVSLSAHYRYFENNSHYDSDPLVQPIATAYPTFIQSRDIITDEVAAKLVWRLSSRFKTSISYQYQSTEYDLSTAPYKQFGNVITPGGELSGGQEHSHTFSASATLVPFPRLFLSTTFSYETSTLITAAGGSPAVVPYQGDIYTVLANGTYVFSKTTDLFAGYFFSEANYGQDNFSSGLPLGIEYRRHTAQFGVARRFGKNISAKMQYRYSYYSEPSSGGATNYRAHSIFGTLTFQFR
jgi:mono/diheme cytochrome c family protein